MVDFPHGDPGHDNRFSGTGAAIIKHIFPTFQGSDGKKRHWPGFFSRWNAALI
jgi:hypothetical protein